MPKMGSYQALQAIVTASTMLADCKFPAQGQMSHNKTVEKYRRKLILGRAKAFCAANQFDDRAVRRHASGIPDWIDTVFVGCGLARVVGFIAIVPSTRAPVLIVFVVAPYYVLFAAMGASGRTLVIEIMGAMVFLLAAVVGFKKSLWIVVAGAVGHGVFDFVHHYFIENPGVPRWWPGFCASYDVIMGVVLAVLLLRRANLAGGISN